jgi:hypothetical protein
MLISSFFTRNSAPITGLTPTIRIWQLDPGGDFLVVTDAAMTETGDGFYKYDFTTFDVDEDYVFRTDGGVPQLDERFQYGASEDSQLETTTIEAIADQVWDEDASTHTIPGSTGATLNLVAAILANRTRIDVAAATLTIYDADCVTPLLIFDLKDQVGNPSVIEVCERKPTVCP